MKILIIEDEEDFAKDMVTYLSSNDYRCEIAPTFEEAKEKLLIYQYDCVLLDLMLPGGTGLQLLEIIKEKHKTEGVIIISAKNSLEDKIQGLNMGADDYLSKPFHLAELAARLHSVLRRKQADSNNELMYKEIVVDTLAKSVVVAGQILILTKKEYELLLFFLGNQNRVLSKGALAEHLSGDMADMFDNYDFVYAHVKNLKKKLAEAGSGNYLKTIYGTGYKWIK